MGVDFKSMAEKLQEHFDSMTDEELQKEIREFFPESTTPKGWVSIEDELPMMMAMDIMEGCTEYKVKFNDETIGVTCVSDHNTWYYYAKTAGITHWWNE